MSKRGAQGAQGARGAQGAQGARGAQGAHGAQGAQGARGAIHARFRAHLRTNVTVAAVILVTSLAMGMIGYHAVAELPWVDAFLNASMLLAGMGPVADLRTDGAKLFAGVYAIYCGVVFIATVGLVLAPVVSHALHHFHLDQGED